MTRDSHRVRTLLVATTNRGKIREIRDILAGGPLELVTLADWPHVGPPEETGRTFEQNARAKAVYYADATGQLTVAEDSGLEIDALGGQPGIESARWGGAETTYPQKFAIIYEAFRAKGAVDSPARFVCALALAQGGEILFEARGTVEGPDCPRTEGRGWIRLRPDFLLPAARRTLAEADDAKAAISHRAAAFRRLREFCSTGRLDGAAIARSRSAGASPGRPARATMRWPTMARCFSISCWMPRSARSSSDVNASR